MHRVTGKGIEVSRQGRHQRLALTGAHLGNTTLVQRHTTDKLNIEMAHAQGAPARFAHRGKGLGQQRVQSFTVSITRAKLLRFGGQFGVAEGLHVRFERVAAANRFTQALEFAIVARAEDFFEGCGKHSVWRLARRSGNRYRFRTTGSPPKRQSLRVR